MNKLFATLFCMTILTTINFAQATIKDLKMKNTKYGYGIEGQSAPELRVDQWIDSNGTETSIVKLKNYKNKFKVIYCFQSWCPGCHSIGLPSLKRMVTELKENNEVEFFAVQTVFEGKHTNTFEKLKEIQDKYDLEIPFGHDVGDASTNHISSIMNDYKTGGTPWFIFIDKNDKVIFNDFHLNTEKAIEYLQSLQ